MEREVLILITGRILNAKEEKKGKASLTSGSPGDTWKGRGKVVRHLPEPES